MPSQLFFFVISAHLWDLPAHIVQMQIAFLSTKWLNMICEFYHKTKGHCVLFRAASQQHSTNSHRVACMPQGCITGDHSPLDKCVRYACECVLMHVCQSCTWTWGEHVGTSQVESMRRNHTTHTHTHTQTCLALLLCCFLVAKHHIDQGKMCNGSSVLCFPVCLPWLFPEWVWRVK